MGVHQGADLRRRRGPQEPRANAGSYRPAAGQGEVLQEANRGGRGDRRPQPGQVPQGGRSPRRRRSKRRCQRAGNGNEEGTRQVCLSWSLRSQQKTSPLVTCPGPWSLRSQQGRLTTLPSTNSHFRPLNSQLLIYGASHSCKLVNEINLKLA